MKGHINLPGVISVLAALGSASCGADASDPLQGEEPTAQHAEALCSSELWEMGISPENILWAAPNCGPVLKLLGGTWVADTGGVFTVWDIAVGPGGVPWAIKNSLIARKTSSSHSSGTWELLPGCASHIGVGANGMVWITGCEGLHNHVYRWNEAARTWEMDTGGGLGMRISVGPTGIPWIVDVIGGIYRKTSNSLSAPWVQLPGCAKDIGVGPHGTWVVGCSGSANAALFKWNESTFNWVQDTAGGLAWTIDSGPGSVPWVLNSQYKAFRKNSGSATLGNWIPLPTP
jgi:hypothetical protein